MSVGQSHPANDCGLLYPGAAFSKRHLACICVVAMSYDMIVEGFYFGNLAPETMSKVIVYTGHQELQQASNTTKESTFPLRSEAR